MSDEEDEAVGYKKPPRKHRFKKGQSGNPKGRRRKVPPTPFRNDMASILERVGNEAVMVNGRETALIELEFMALQRKAAKGDVAASRHLAKLRADAGVGLAPVQRGGVLVVPRTVPLNEWSIAAVTQQAEFRSADYANPDKDAYDA